MSIGDNSAALDTVYSPSRSATFRACIDFLRSSVSIRLKEAKEKARRAKEEKLCLSMTFCFAIKSLSCSFFHHPVFAFADKCPHRYTSSLPLAWVLSASSTDAIAVHFISLRYTTRRQSFTFYIFRLPHVCSCHCIHAMKDIPRRSNKWWRQLPCCK